MLTLGGLLALAAAVIVGYLAALRRRRLRVRSARAAFMEAAVDDERFDPDRISREVRRQLESVDAALTDGRHAPLEVLFGAEALSLRRRFSLEPESPDPVVVRRSRRWRIEPVALTNTANEPPRAVVLVETRIAVWRRGFLGGFWPARLLTLLSAPLMLDGRLAVSSVRRAFLVLRARGGGWHLERVEYGGEGWHHLAAPLLANPADDPALRDRAVRELASDGPGGDPPIIPGGTPHPGAREALLDLSLADDRFDPEVVTALLRDVVSALARDPHARDPRLEHLCSGLARTQLATLSGLGSPRLSWWRPAKFVASDPPELFVELEIIGGRRRFAVPKPLWKLGLDPEGEPQRGVWKLRFAPGTTERWVVVSAFGRRELDTGRASALLDPLSYE